MVKNINNLSLLEKTSAIKKNNTEGCITGFIIKVTRKEVEQWKSII